MLLAHKMTQKHAKNVKLKKTDDKINIKTFLVAPKEHLPSSREKGAKAELLVAFMAEHNNAI